MQQCIMGANYSSDENKAEQPGKKHWTCQIPPTSSPSCDFQQRSGLFFIREALHYSDLLRWKPMFRLLQFLLSLAVLRFRKQTYEPEFLSFKTLSFVQREMIWSADLLTYYIIIQSQNNMHIQIWETTGLNFRERNTWRTLNTQIIIVHEVHNRFAPHRLWHHCRGFWVMRC